MARPSTSTRGRVAAAVPTAVAVALLAAACGGGEDGDSTSARQAGDGDPHTVSVVLTTKGCKPDTSTVKSGPLTFKVRNKNATAVSEVELRKGARILGEKENLAPGFSGSFSLDLGAGKYEIYCPGAAKEHFPFTVTGEAAPQRAGDVHSLLQRGTRQYADYVRKQVAKLVKNTKPLVTAVKSGDLAKAKEYYPKARPFYEHIEPVAESFKGLDPAIDARANDVPTAKWGGFHKIEQGIYQKKSLKGLGPVADTLQKDVKKLQSLVADLKYQPAELANGAVSLLDEVAKSKITGEEERYSHIDIVDFHANIEGAEQAYAGVAPALKKIAPDLATRVDTQFDKVNTLLNEYRDASAPGGFVSYSKVDKKDQKKMAAAVHALAEPLSKVASKIVNA